MKTLSLLVFLAVFANTSNAQLPEPGLSLAQAEKQIHMAASMVSDTGTDIGAAHKRIAYWPYPLEGIDGILILDYDSSLHIRTAEWTRSSAQKNSSLTYMLSLHPNSPFALATSTIPEDVSIGQYNNVVAALEKKYGHATHPYHEYVATLARMKQKLSSKAYEKWFKSFTNNMMIPQRVDDLTSADWDSGGVMRWLELSDGALHLTLLPRPKDIADY